MRLAVISLVSLLPATALAWRHNGTALAPEDRPLRWSVEVSPQVANLTPEQVLDDLKATMAAWGAASCGLETEFVGEVAYEDPTDVPAGELHFTFAPLGRGALPWVQLGDSTPGEPLFQRDGLTYLRQRPGAWVINTDLDLASEQAIAAGDCSDQVALSTIAGLLLGDRLGLGRSSDPEALMSAQVRSCAVQRPGADDAAGLDALYGPWAGFVCDNPDDPFGLDEEVAGVVPFQVSCSLEHDAQSAISGATWSWGDGTRTEGTSSQHTYTAEDNFTLGAKVVGEHATCGTFELDLQRFGYVRSCDVPQPSFELIRYRGLEFQTENASDVSTYGCHTGVTWEAFDPEGDRVLRVTAWEPRLRFPEDGEYRVVLTVDGAAGSESDEVWLNTRSGSVRGYSVGSGCSSLAPLGGASLAGLLLMLGLTRRRR